MIPELFESRSLAPRGKFRGKRRYFRAVRDAAATFQIQKFPGGWGTWRWPADLQGWGNVRWKYRLEHLKALAVVFRRIVGEAHDLPSPFQAWIYLSGRDAAEDAVYLHSPNDYGEAYPVQFVSRLRWDDDRLRPLTDRLLPGLDVRIGHSRMLDQWAEPPGPRSSFYIYSPGIGDPLELGEPGVADN